MAGLTFLTGGGCLKAVPILLTLLHFANSQYYLEHKFCAVFYSGPNLNGEQLTLQNGDQSISLLAANQRFFGRGWEMIGSIIVGTGCKLTLCNGTRLDSLCRIVEAGQHLNLNISNVSFAKCNCQKACKCSDIFLDKTKCARAYLKGGCKICNTPYTDLEAEEKQVPDDVIGHVEAFRLRKGCTLTLYPDKNFQGDKELITDGIVEDYQKKFRSYTCECNKTGSQSGVKPRKPSLFTPLTDITEKLKEIARTPSKSNRGIEWRAQQKKLGYKMEEQNQLESGKNNDIEHQAKTEQSNHGMQPSIDNALNKKEKLGNLEVGEFLRQGKDWEKTGQELEQNYRQAVPQHLMGNGEKNTLDVDNFQNDGEITDQERSEMEQMKQMAQRAIEDEPQIRQYHMSDTKPRLRLASLANTQPPGCLKKGTKILMADMTVALVETVQVGDLIMDKDLKPTQVLGVSFEFLANHKFFGFSNNSFFFTSSHLFIGPASSKTDELKLYAKSLPEVYRYNPLMEYMDVAEMDANNGTRLFHLPNLEDNVRSTLDEGTFAIFEDPNSYPPETPVYFVIVDSPTGTYFANGYVCRHDIPPFELWPNTMALLFRLTETDTLQKFNNVPYELATMFLMDGVTDQVAEAVQSYIANKLGSPDWIAVEQPQFPVMTISDINLECYLSKIFANPTFSLMANYVYAKVGRVIAPYLDSSSFGKPEVIGVDTLGQIQHELFIIITGELENQLKLL